MSEGESWSVEIEQDCFSEEDGPVVAIWLENVYSDENDGKPTHSLAQATAEQARGMAAALVKCAEALDKRPRS